MDARTALHHLLMRTPPHPRRAGRRSLQIVTVLAVVASGALPGLAGARTGPADRVTGPAAPALPALPLAVPSPDLPGLPAVSAELLSVPVSGAAVEQALDRYEAVDAVLASSQARRTELDRALAGAGAQRRRLEADLAAARARAASARSRLHQVTAAIADLGVSLFVTGGSTARLDAALAAEQPSINDQDRQQVLGSATLDVLLAEQAAYQARVDEAEARAGVAEEALRTLAADRSVVSEARPAAGDAEVAAGPPVAERRVAYESARVLGLVEDVDFPLVALDAYHRASRSVAEEDPACGVGWWALAGISRIEGRHGTYGGSSLDERGDTTKRIVGIQLNGTNETQVVPDTDGGTLDGDAAYDRAVGPMQFIPGTWSRFAADGNGDGLASPFNLYDATLAAARYLCHGSQGLDQEGSLRAAYFSYNHSLAYVETVLTWARRYESSVELPAPERGS